MGENCTGSFVRHHSPLSRFSFIEVNLYSLVTKLLVTAILLLGALAAALFVNAMVNLINIHFFFATLAIFWMDALWRAEFDQEPALCVDCRYLLSLERVLGNCLN